MDVICSPWPLPERGTGSRFESLSAHMRYSGERDSSTEAGQRPGTESGARAGSRDNAEASDRAGEGARTQQAGRPGGARPRGERTERTDGGERAGRARGR